MKNKAKHAMAELTQDSFLADVANHAMTIAKDDGVYRHVIFAKPGSYHMRFELITWPGYLCYTGDMGTFVFLRLEDMFEFFRNKHQSNKLSINADYWSEKLEAADRVSGAKEWSADRFREVIESYLNDDSEPLPEGLREAIVEEVLSRINDGQHEAYRAASDFEYGGFRFNDIWDHDFTVFTYRFIWCCYALVWGIGKYDDTQRTERP